MNDVLKILITIAGIAMIVCLFHMALREHRFRNARFEAREKDWQPSMKWITMCCEGPSRVERETVITYSVVLPVLTQVVGRVITTVVHDTFITHPRGDNHPPFKTPHPYTNLFDWLRDQTNAWPVDYTVECNEDVKDAQPQEQLTCNCGLQTALAGKDGGK
jgi:hypothetical protein